jgi:phosphohistidine phosphatase
MRHGTAVDREAWDGDDAVRPLTEEGRAELQRVAEGLHWLDLKIEMVVTSPLTRARETAEPVAQALGVPLQVNDALAPGCTLHALAPLLLSSRSMQGMLIVGHEPNFSELIGLLIAGHNLAHVAMKKGACCRLDLPSLAKLEHERDVDKLAGRTTLRWLLTAPQLARLGTPGRDVTSTAEREDGDVEESTDISPMDGDSEQGGQSSAK